MERGEAETLYVEAIMKRGNPRFFIYKTIDRWSNDELLAMMEEMDLEIESFGDEE